MKSIHTSRKNTSGFSLVEIALALGVVGFALAAVLGLLATASDVSADSTRETVMVSMTSQITADLRSVPFDALWDSEPHDYNGRPPGAGATPADTVYFFTAEGARLDALNAANNPAAIYRCVVKKTIDEASTAPQTPTTPERANLLRLQLVYEWPVAAPEANRQKHISHANIARY